MDSGAKHVAHRTCSSTAVRSPNRRGVLLGGREDRVQDAALLLAPLLPQVRARHPRVARRGAAEAGGARGALVGLRVRVVVDEAEGGEGLEDLLVFILRGC